MLPRKEKRKRREGENMKKSSYKFITKYVLR